jgi:hypothetical protein
VADDLVDKALSSGLVQPDSTTCGSSVLVVARMLHDPAYAAFLVNGVSTAVGGPRIGGSLQDRFREQALAMHGVTSRLKDNGGGLQVPWPKALGTQPWALARQMTATAGARGTRYGVTAILPGQRSRVFARIGSCVTDGVAVPLYVGNRWSPRHVVLALPQDGPVDDELTIYDPARGRLVEVEEDDFVDADLDLAGWDVPWAAVLPS